MLAANHVLVFESLSVRPVPIAQLAKLALTFASPTGAIE